MSPFPSYYSHKLLDSFKLLKPTKMTAEEEDQNKIQQKLVLIDQLQTEIDYLFYEWNAIHIVLESVRNAFTTKHITPEFLDEVDRELSIAYDDLKYQVRQLERRLKKTSRQVHQHLIQNSERH